MRLLPFCSYLETEANKIWGFWNLSSWVMDARPMNRGSFSTSDKRFFSFLQPVGHEADHSSSSNAAVKNAGIFVSYLSTLSVGLSICSVEWEKYLWMAIWEGYKTKWPCHYRGTTPAHAWRDWVNHEKLQVMVSAVPAIRAEHFRKMSQQRYRWSSLLGEYSLFIVKPCGTHIYTMGAECRLCI